MLFYMPFFGTDLSPPHAIVLETLAMVSPDQKTLELGVPDILTFKCSYIVLLCKTTFFTSDKYVRHSRRS